MTARLLDTEEVALPFREEVARRIRDEGLRLKLAGLLVAGSSKPSHVYARYADAACKQVGIEFDLREVERLAIEDEIRRANDDPSVHGLLVFYPVFDGERDHYVKEIVDPRKDLEGLGSQYSFNLYNDIRWLGGDESKKSIIPCTPLALIKILEHLQVYRRRPDDSDPRPSLHGRTVVIVNRSEVVGRPLAAMLAHDGARVHSIDIDGCQLMDGGTVTECHETLEDSLPAAEVVVTGVPDKTWRLPASGVRSDAVLINFSSWAIIPDEAIDKAAVFVSGPGRVTVAMALRNLLRLYDNFHSGTTG